MSAPTLDDLDALIKRCVFLAFADDKMTHAINFSAVRYIERTKTEWRLHFSETHVTTFPRTDYADRVFGRFFQGL